MKRNSLVFTTPLRAEILEALRRDVEVAGVILARPVIRDGGVRLLARQIVWVPSEQYSRQDAFGLSIRSEGYVPALAIAEHTGCVPIWFHTHPGEGSCPIPSSHDRVVDDQVAELFRLRSGSPLYVTLIASPSRGDFVFTGTIQQDAMPTVPLDRIWIIGDRLRLSRSFGDSSTITAPEFDRSVRAFGPVVQNTLADMRVGIVGCGGTGSAVAEQLTRLGVRRLTLFDADTLSASNVSRVYGSHPKQVGHLKAGVLADHLCQIAPDATIEAVIGMITTRSIAERLTDQDVVFGCTDDNAGRLVLSRLSTYFLVPVFDCGVLLSNGPDGALADINLRVTTLLPGQACLICRNRVDLARAASELLTPDERKKRIDEGYAPALGNIEPAVVTFTTTVASLAVSEFLERLIGYGPEPRPSEMLYRAHEREISTNVCLPRERHYCHESSGKIGLGVTEPLMEQAWPDSH